MADPSWIENPRPLFQLIKRFLERGGDPQQKHEAMVAEREAAVAEAREKLANHPVDLKGQFEALLFAAQSCSFLQEDHNHWIDQRGLHEVRQVCLAVGRRLVEAGKLASADDVFLFTVPELRELATGTASGIETARKRRAEMQRWAAVTPPPMVGTDYGPPPENPITRAIGRMLGTPPPASNENVIRGHAGSPGKVRGIARVINTIDEADRLGVGEILVVPTTSPPWTPLFGIAAAVVTDTGGALSHCAVVCREYGIPGVVGTQVATARIRDGQEVEVDGEAGTVRLL
jgi:pyruvate,water dikinase